MLKPSVLVYCSRDKIVKGDVPMSKRSLVLAVLLMAAILVSGCCCCCSGDRSLYSPATPSIYPSATPIKVTVVPVYNSTMTASPASPVITP